LKTFLSDSSVQVKFQASQDVKWVEFVAEYMLNMNIQSKIYIKGTQENLKMWNCEKPEIICIIHYSFICIIHYSLMGEMRLPFIDSDLLYRGAL